MGASSGSIAIGANSSSTVNISNVDADVAKDAINSSADVAKKAFDYAGDVVSKTTNLASLQTSSLQTDFIAASSQQAQALSRLSESVVNLAGRAVDSSQVLAASTAPVTPSGALNENLKSFFPYAILSAAVFAVVILLKRSAA